MQRNVRKGLMAAVALCALVALSDAAQAQNRRGNWNRGYPKAQVERIIRRVENQSDRFIATFDRGLDRSGLDGTLREDRLNDRARELESDLDMLRQEFDRTDRYQDTRQQVSRVLTTAESINTVVRRRRLPNATENQWSRLRSELNALASIYNLRRLR